MTTPLLQGAMEGLAEPFRPFFPMYRTTLYLVIVGMTFPSGMVAA